MNSRYNKREERPPYASGTPSRIHKTAHPDPQLDARPGEMQLTPAERRVAGLFRKWGLDWEFERPVYVQDPSGRPRIWTPDFFLPALRIYVEVVGNPEADYSFREQVFVGNYEDVLFVRPHEANWIGSLLEGIQRIEAERIGRFRSVMGRIKNNGRYRRPPVSR
jgi:hypothetical protein